jgi:predicted lipoprotein
MKHLVLAAALCAAAFALSSCGDSKSGTGPSTESTFADSTFLRQMAAHRIVPGYERYNQSLVDLEKALTWTGAPDSSQLEAGRQAYLQANLAWQNVTPFEFGPAMDALLSVHTNLFPVDTAKIESNIASQIKDLNSYQFYMSKGLGTLDYLLFGSGALDSLQKSQRRDYALVLVQDLRKQLSPVLSAWQGEFGAQFPKQLGTAMDGSMSRLFNQFSFEFEAIRRFKLGYPLGILSLTPAKPQDAEARWSGYSDTLLAASIGAVRSLYFGKTGDSAYMGFSDKVKALGKNTLDSTIRQQWSQIDAKLADYRAKKLPIHQIVVQDPASAKAVFDAMQGLIAYHKVDLASALSLTINYQDNDGD